ncbi:MAG: hypothetical protein ABW005_10735 [Burkholderiaceae bacterium]
MIPLTGVLVGAAVWGFAFWWFGRKLRSAGDRVTKLEAIRQQLNVQVSQARRQVEQLQKDMAELRMAQAHGPAGPARAQPARPAPQAAAPDGRAAGDGFAPTQILPGGFAHTQLQPRKA